MSKGVRVRSSRVFQLGAALVAAVATLVLGAARAEAIEVAANNDCMTTEAGDTSVTIGPLPSGFFGSKSGTPSDPYPETEIALQGDPFEAEVPCGSTFRAKWPEGHDAAVGRHLAKVATNPDVVDTIVQRKTSVEITEGSPVRTIDIEIIALSLMSVAPITITYAAQPSSDFDVHVGLDGEQAEGEIEVTGDEFGPGSASGQIAVNSLPVKAAITFTEAAPGTGEYTLTPGTDDFSSPTPGTFEYDIGIPLLPGWGIVVLGGLLLLAAMWVSRRGLATRGQVS